MDVKSFVLGYTKGKQSGGGGGDDQLAAFLDGSLTELHNSNVTAIADYMLDNNTLKSIDFPQATSIGRSALDKCSALESINLPEVTSIGNYAFRQTGLTSVKLPKLVTMGEGAFQGCKKLVSADFSTLGKLTTYGFYTCSALTTLILRMENTIGYESRALESTTIRDGKGYIYVPASQVDTYKSEWAAFDTKFRALEDYTVDGTITGELDPNKI